MDPKASVLPTTPQRPTKKVCCESYDANACRVECLRIKINSIAWWKEQTQFSFQSHAIGAATICHSIQHPALPSCESRLFSAAGCTVSARRTALSSENVDDILFIHSNGVSGPAVLDHIGMQRTGGSIPCFPLRSHTKTKGVPRPKWLRYFLKGGGHGLISGPMVNTPLFFTTFKKLLQSTQC